MRARHGWVVALAAISGASAAAVAFALVPGIDLPPWRAAGLGAAVGAMLTIRRLRRRPARHVPSA